jgi:protein TonB
MASVAITSRDRLSFTLFLAASLHAAIILGVGFSAELNMPDSPTVEVTLAQYSDAEAPEDADFIAQSNQLGSGSEEDIRELTATQEAEFSDSEFQEVIPEPIPAIPEAQLERRELLTATQSDTEAVTTSDETPLGELLSTTTSSDPTINALAQEIASLEARIAVEQQALSRQPRVKRLTSVSTKSADEAAYLNMWRQKVERVGNANYPAGIYGDLRMLVVLNYDGQLKDVRVLKSSGYRQLDDAALRIVRIAAPYSSFPVDMRKKYDQLEIIRTWKFSRAGAQLGS